MTRWLLSDWVWRNRNRLSWAAVVTCGPLATWTFIAASGPFAYVAYAAGTISAFAAILSAYNLIQDHRMRRKYGSAWE